jgi:hypothetical protein
MASCDWFTMTWTSKNLMWKFNFGTYLPKPTLTYGITKILESSKSYTRKIYVGNIGAYPRQTFIIVLR